MAEPLIGRQLSTQLRPSAGCSRYPIAAIAERLTEPCRSRCRPGVRQGREGHGAGNASLGHVAHPAGPLCAVCEAVGAGFRYGLSFDMHALTGPPLGLEHPVSRTAKIANGMIRISRVWQMPMLHARQLKNVNFSLTSSRTFRTAGLVSTQHRHSAAHLPIRKADIVGIAIGAAPLTLSDHGKRQTGPSKRRHHERWGGICAMVDLCRD